MQRRRIRVNGIVQGVGFRPFVYRLATSLNLAGSVNNDSQGVTIEIEGDPASVESFCSRLLRDKPALATIDECRTDEIPSHGGGGFRIDLSRSEHAASTLISPDVAVCDDCLRELFDPRDRRYRYPFINCTNCGPRFTIVERIPYDRPNTSMKRFLMCPDCDGEYHDPSNRRFHAQPNACPICGPRLSLHGPAGEVNTPDTIETVIDLLAAGKIVAIRGLGGFHLAVDARSDDAVRELRRRKGRAEKPLALMARDISTIRDHCVVSPGEEDLLRHFTRPIVLMRRLEVTGISRAVASDNKYFGFMLPYTPLHHLLLHGPISALVMTSGNYSDEPIAIANDDARRQLDGIADYFVFHDRDILQRCDDSIVRRAGGGNRIIRRARGFVPRPIYLTESVARPILAVGGELKNTNTLARENKVFFSQHIGDLDNPAAFDFFTHSVEYLTQLLEIEPQVIACDLHPEYLSTKWAVNQTRLPVIAVQHHHAHMASVLAENRSAGPAIGLILDGTGFGTDGAIWGGEILVGDAASFERFAWLEPVPMPGGTAAVRQPWRMALSYLRYAFGSSLPEGELRLLRQTDELALKTVLHMIDTRLNSPMTSGCGRLFDGVAAILDLCRENRFEAQAAIALEMAATAISPLRRDLGASIIPDPRPGPMPFDWLIRDVVDSVLNSVDTATVAARFHVSLAELLIAGIREARERTGLRHVALSGGVYQNLLFFEYMNRRLVEEGFDIITHHDVPTNDGGLALGQMVIANEILKRRQ